MCCYALDVIETPPRTWRRPIFVSNLDVSIRNTSTYVEKTFIIISFTNGFEKHLHVRGEDSRLADKIPFGLETPPRTWRRLAHAQEDPLAVGNTSTYVEKTYTAHIKLDIA